MSDEPTILMDTPEDAYCEERGWVPHAMADTPAEAEQVMREKCPLDDTHMEYACSGQFEWLRPLGVKAPQGEGPFPDAWWHADEKDEEGGRWMEFCCWDECAPTHPEAVEFWLVEVIEKTREVA